MYRELVPDGALLNVVRAYFSFTPSVMPWRGRHRVIREVAISHQDTFCAPLFADGHTSIVVDLGASCRLGGSWTFGAPVSARVIGAMRAVGAPAGTARAEMLGAYLQPGAAAALLHTSAIELTDRVVELEYLWGQSARDLAHKLAEDDEVRRVERFESSLLHQLWRARAPRARFDVSGLARWVRSDPTGSTVRRLADAAGVSRRHLTRVFREIVGVGPKRYSRLARFQAGLIYAGAGKGVAWGRVSADLGYADQSHMIAEFREFSSLTPEMLATERWFHPFILEARNASRLRGARAVIPR